ncbi:TetR/AcrR family transcriptional regulator [Mycolicibacterium diernhoferi]|nr:TetR/AcrR family transcriptional regulator [Mycolicibacterium diernhoferi]OJZ65176.1 TetR family transcriptional regulator [Mycolicibacterium diernhoferi]
MARSVLGRGSARARVLEAALTLFGEHGVGGTTLQMIADSIGVGKASVYYQFRSKEDIVAAAAQPMFDDMARVVTIAEAVEDTGTRREIAVCGLIELCVRNRRWAAVLNGDPALDSLIESRADLTELIGRYTDLLLGAGHGPAGRVIISMVTKGIQGAVTDKAVQDVSDDDLHQTLLAAVQQLLRTASFFE